MMLNYIHTSKGAFMDTLQDRIYYAMEKRDMSQADIARRSGLSTAVVSQICSGKTKDPHFDKVVLIAKALNVSLDYLAGFKPFGRYNG